MVSSTTNSHVLIVFRNVESIKKTHMSTTITTEYHSLVNENFNLCDTSYVRYLPGLLLLVVLAVHSAVDHETT